MTSNTTKAIIGVLLTLTLTGILLNKIYLFYTEPRQFNYYLTTLNTLPIMKPIGSVPNYDAIEHPNSGLWTVIETLEAGETLKILGIYYSKHSQIFKVEMSDSRIGFCVNGAAIEKTQNKTP